MMFGRRRRVVMRISVGEHEAGCSYRLPAAIADAYVAKGYADGILSRSYTADELAVLRGPAAQTVRFD